MCEFCDRVIGHNFFDGDVSIIITSEHYVDMLKSFFEPNFSDHEDFQNEERWFKQDGATTHTARQSVEIVLEMFPERLISLRAGDLTDLLELLT